MQDPYNLQRFIDAQQPLYKQVCAELRAGYKTTHWMWFIFPQIAGLGQSATARRYALAGLAEAAAYIEQPLLGARLRECTELANGIENRTAQQIFGEIDAMKFHSSMTLFAAATLDNELFNTALRKYFGGRLDRATLERI
ncbi:MAG TPA: DUF1810 domain-containing protein [Spongiibacteraceae bacterium]|nr:DUF1810 domain-containing protein [Spongiibacteraceae bacterium]